MKLFLMILLTLFSNLLISQIRIDDVGDGWKSKVDSSLNLIKLYDVEKYNLVYDVCNHITYWNGLFSTTEDSTTIMITQKDMMSSINNISAVIVHESKHLYYLKHSIKLEPNFEEILCYTYELNFLKRIPSVEPWLITNAEKKIKYYYSLINIK